MHPWPHIHVSRQRIFHMNVRLRMYQYWYVDTIFNARERNNANLTALNLKT